MVKWWCNHLFSMESTLGKQWQVKTESCKFIRKKYQFYILVFMRCVYNEPEIKAQGLFRYPLYLQHHNIDINQNYFSTHITIRKNIKNIPPMICFLALDNHSACLLPSVLMHVYLSEENNSFLHDPYVTNSTIIMVLIYSQERNHETTALPYYPTP